MDGLLFVLTLLAAVGCGLSAGALFAFSGFVMAALARLSPARGNEAMQSINLLAPTPAFMTALFGTGLLCAALAVWGAFTLDEGYGIYLLAGGAVYLLGPVGLTMGYSVPRNNALAVTDPDSAEGSAYWAVYQVEWTRANHVRVAAGLAASALLMLALAA